MYIRRYVLIRVVFRRFRNSQGVATSYPA